MTAQIRHQPAQLLEQLRLLTDSGAVIVFPTDITARYWQKKLIASSIQLPHDERGVSTVGMWSDSIMAWDVFKATYLFSHLSLQPISHIQRMMFAYSLAYRQMQKNLFSSIMQEHNPIGSSAIEYIVYLLPYLHQLIADSNDKPIAQRDAQLVYAYYTQYMDTLGVYEPFWNRPLLGNVEPVNIFFVELIQDINYFQSSIKSRTIQSTASLSTQHTLELPQHCTALLFSNSLDEVLHHAIAIRRLVDEGVDPHDIHVTVGNIQSIAPTVAMVFSRYAIPYTLHTSMKIADTLFGVIIRSMLTISLYDAPYFHIKELIENQNIPLKDRDRLVRFLSRVQHKHRLYNVFLGDISKSLKAVASTRSFAQLQTALTIFFDNFIDSTQWSAQELHEISFGLSILDTVVGIELLQDTNYTDALKIFVAILNNTVYRAPRINSGINIYGMPVSAGIYPRYHFVMNVSNQSLENLNKTHRLAKQYNIDTDRFLYEPNINQLLHAYATSGEKVYFSCSYAHASTATVPYPPLFADVDITSVPFSVALKQEIPHIVHPIIPTMRPAIDAHRAVYAASHNPLWFNDTQLIPEQTRVLNNSYRTPRYFTDDSVSQDTLPIDSTNHTTTDNTIHISLRHLRMFNICPYGLLFELMCRPHHIQHDIDINNYTGIGSVIHGALSQILRAQRSTRLGTTFRPPNAKEIGTYITTTEHLASYQQPMLHDVIVHEITYAIDILIEQFNGWRILHTDVEVTKDIPDTPCRYSGIIDLLLQSSDSSICTIIDFKRSAKSISFHQNKYDQLLYYAVLAQHNAIDCRYAYYVLLAERKLAPSSRAKRDELFAPHSTAIREMQSAMAACAHTIASGDYRVSIEGSRCQHCTSVGQCRRYYH